MFSQSKLTNLQLKNQPSNLIKFTKITNSRKSRSKITNLFLSLKPKKKEALCSLLCQVSPFPLSLIQSSTQYKTIQWTIRKQHHNTYISQQVIVQSDIIARFIVKHIQKKKKKKTRTWQPQNHHHVASMVNWTFEVVMNLSYHRVGTHRSIDCPGKRTQGDLVSPTCLRSALVWITSSTLSHPTLHLR